VSSVRVHAVKYADTVPDMNGYPHEVSRVQLVRQWCHSLWLHRLPAVVATACLSVVLVLFISPTARERLVWNFPNFLSHSNFLPISARDTRPEGRMARGRRHSIGCLAFERVANGARPGLGHNRDCLQSLSLHINTYEPVSAKKQQLCNCNSIHIDPHWNHVITQKYIQKTWKKLSTRLYH